MPRTPKHQPLPKSLHRALPPFEKAARASRRTAAVPTAQLPGKPTASSPESAASR